MWSQKYTLNFDENAQYLINNFIQIQTFKIQKDRVGLLNFRNTFREGSNDYIKANIILADDKV